MQLHELVFCSSFFVYPRTLHCIVHVNLFTINVTHLSEERLEGSFIDADNEGPVFDMDGKLDMPSNGGCVIVSGDEEEEDESDNEVIYRRTHTL